MARQSIAVSAADHRSLSLIAELRAAGLAADVGEAPALWLVVADLLPALAARIAALPGSAPALVIVEDATLAASIEVLRTDPRIVGVIGEREGDAEAVAFARKVLGEGGWQGRMRTVADTASSRAAIDEVRAAAIEAGLGGARVDAVEQCADELLTNALYAAPVDAQGVALFERSTPRERLELRTQHEVTVSHAREGGRFLVSVRDAFGTLDRARVLDRLLTATRAGNVERKAAGAGLGLFLVANEAVRVTVDVVPGASTTITCGFEASRAGPASGLALVVHPPAATRTHARVVRTSAARRRRLARAVAGIAAVSVVAGVLIVGLAQPSLTIVVSPPDATVELDGWVAARDRDGRAVATDLAKFSSVRVHAYRRGFTSAREAISLRLGARAHAITLAPVATVLVTSEPAGARVEIAGAFVGTTPAAITSRPPGDKIDVSLSAPGYQPATIPLVVPTAGETTKHAQPLTRDPAYAEVRLVSDPPGARVVRIGEPATTDRTYTPTSIMVPRSAATKFVVEMPGRVPFPITVGPDVADGVERVAVLVPHAP